MLLAFCALLRQGELSGNGAKKNRKTIAFLPRNDSNQSDRLRVVCFSFACDAIEKIEVISFHNNGFPDRLFQIMCTTRAR